MIQQEHDTEEEAQAEIDTLLAEAGKFYTESQVKALLHFLHTNQALFIESGDRFINTIQPVFDNDRLVWDPSSIDRSNFGPKLIEDDFFEAYNGDFLYIVPKFSISRLASPAIHDVLGPRDIPKLRVHLMEQWEPFKAFRNTVREITSRTAEECAGLAEMQTETFRKAGMWWVADEMVDVLTATTPGVPNDVTVNNIELPAPAGFVVFQKDIDVTATGIDAITWDMLPHTGALTISAYRSVNLADGFTKEELAGIVAAGLIQPNQTDNVMWLYLGSAAWGLTDELTHINEDLDLDESLVSSFIGLRRLLAAFVTLVAQEAISEIEYQPIPRPERRRAARSGVAREANDLRIVTLRKKARNVVEDDDTEPVEGRSVVYSHRWLVNPHYRWQRVGKGRTERRLTLVTGYVKGPEDKPLKIKQEVKAWVR